MKLLRFITEEEMVKIKEISQRKDLVSDNKGRYYLAEQLDKDEDIIFMNQVLREVIEGFKSFSNFMVNDTDRIRFQYDWCAGDDAPSGLASFIAVGWIQIDELKNGFKVKE